MRQADADAVWSPSIAREKARALLRELLTDEGWSPPIAYEEKVAALRRMLKQDRVFDTAEGFAKAMKNLGFRGENTQGAEGVERR